MYTHKIHIFHFHSGTYFGIRAHKLHQKYLYLTSIHQLNRFSHSFELPHILRDREKMWPLFPENVIGSLNTIHTLRACGMMCVGFKRARLLRIILYIHVQCIHIFKRDCSSRGLICLYQRLCSRVDVAFEARWLRFSAILVYCNRFGKLLFHSIYQKPYKSVHQRGECFQFFGKIGVIALQMFINFPFFKHNWHTTRVSLTNCFCHIDKSNKLTK